MMCLKHTTLTTMFNRQLMAHFGPTYSLNVLTHRTTSFAIRDVHGCTLFAMLWKMPSSFSVRRWSLLRSVN